MTTLNVRKKQRQQLRKEPKKQKYVGEGEK